MTITSTRAQTNGDVTVWPYIWKNERVWLLIRRELVTKADEDEELYNIYVKLIKSNKENIEITDKERTTIMAFILWWEGREQVEEVEASKILSEFDSDDRWSKILDDDNS